MVGSGPISKESEMTEKALRWMNEWVAFEQRRSSIIYIYGCAKSRSFPSGYRCGSLGDLDDPSNTTQIS